MVHFFPILQIRFLAFVIRKHEKAFAQGGIGTEILSPYCPPIRIHPWKVSFSLQKNILV